MLLLLLLISFVFIISFVQFKKMLVSLWGDEGIQTAFQRFEKIYLAFSFRISYNCFSSFVLTFSCIGFLFAFQYLFPHSLLQAKWIPADWLGAVFPKQCREDRRSWLRSHTAGILPCFDIVSVGTHLSSLFLNIFLLKIYMGMLFAWCCCLSPVWLKLL